ncbi:amino acid adenylation domain-containing protein [Streptomyces sp. SR27]|uniref:non-ribosomal peptide synthetase n=1 Tax=Streptomyces sp. SR27 TaxID=3076630 RepID=UPI00295BC624|nr:non-ribosomal peptide synthetase [Streptomyces sp. SR27]MDV9187432.1 amino acid adenylation domain-containing protein [Streptomyces sp. SR27]
MNLSAPFPEAYGRRPSSLVELLRSRAERQPDRLAYVILDSHGEEEARLTYARLDHRARVVAATLQEQVKTGDRVLILHQPGADYLSAYFGCLYAGAVAVPCYPPHTRSLPRLRAVAADAAPVAALLGDRITAGTRRRLVDAPELRDVALFSNGDLTADAEQWTDPLVGTDSLAFLQYTSGSTAAPKGVMVSHGNLLYNSAQIQRRIRASEDSLCVSWLPPYHDMGLIGGILQPLAAGFPAVLMAPGTFVLDPVQWLRAISAYRATNSPTPPFALDLCVERVDPAVHEPLDLSSLESVIVGAEPVRAATLDRFAGHFAPWGFRRDALRPSYGLAEATLMVSCGAHITPSSTVTVDVPTLEAHRVAPGGEGSPGTTGGGSGRSRDIVGCGSAVDGQRLVVVDPATAAVCGPDRVGEIWVGGPSVAHGYWGRPDESEAAFEAELSTGEGPFLRTGDLGFLRDGELFVTGRSKDLIIVRGRNLYPHDIERCAERAHPALQANSSAAVAVDDDGTEQLLLVAEVRRGAELPPVAEVARQLGRVIVAEFDVRLHRLVLVRTGTIPKTSSGKIRRRATRQALLDGALTVVGEWTSGAAQEPEPPTTDRRRSAVEAYLSDLVATLVTDTAGGPDRQRPLLDLGLDSLATLRLVGRVERDLGVDVSEDVFDGDPTIATLAAIVVERHTGGLPLDDAGRPLPAETPALGTTPALTPASGLASTPDTAGTGAADPAALPDAPFAQTDTQQAYCLGRTGAFELGNVSTHVYLEFDAPDLDLPRFEHAWRRVIHRHEMLRAVMLPDSNEQRILTEVPPYEIRVTDLRGREHRESEDELAAIRERLSHEVRPADRWPLFEVAATRLDDGLRVHLSVDSLIADFSSGRLLFDDLSRFYEEPDARPPRPEKSFRDHVRAETERRNRAAYRRSRDHWWSRLPELPPAPQLPGAARAGSIDRPRFTRRETTLPAELWQGLKERAGRAGLTPTGLLLAAYAEVLAAWSAGRHFTLNVPRLNRPVHDPSYREVIGQFASFTLLEVDFRTGSTFLDRARGLQRQLRSDLRHQDVGGVEVLRELMRLQGGFDQALMPVVMTSNLTFATEERTALEKLLTPVFAVSQTPQVSLDEQVQEEEGALLLNWDAVDELFPAGLVDDMFAAHTALLRALATDERTWDLRTPLALPPAQAKRRRSSFGPARAVPDIQVQHLFERQVAARPDAPAVIAPDRTLSYAELDAAARRVAGWLRTRGARPGRLVAVVMDKGWEQAVAAYAVLFSGAAYLPIDPELPGARLRRLLAKGEVELVLTRSRLDETLDWPTGPLRLCLDRPLPAVTDTPLPSDGSPADLAYTMFTSGSTGEPKGVAVSHRALVNCLVETLAAFRITEDDRCLAVSALHHDLSVFDLFGVLGAGGTMVVPAAADRRDPAHWARLIAAHGVTVWNSVPAMMEMLLEATGGDNSAGTTGSTRSTGSAGSPGSPGALASLRLAFLGGDWIPLAVPRRLADAAPGIETVSVGGPTETTLWSIWHRIAEVDPAWRSVPYGTPLANVGYHLLDERLEECPEWVTGEMYVSGVCLADGYWRDAERTDAVFTTHPRSGERMYRTGDLGRWRPDGTVEFMGRADFQVKIRGQRIELGEIEAALRAHPEVSSAVVTATGRTDRPGHDGLVAYVIPEATGGGGRPTGGGTRAGAGDGLPDATDVEEARRSGVTVLDPLDRAAFKLARHGLRREADRPRVVLPPVADEPSRRRSDRAFLSGPLDLAELADCLGVLRQEEVDGLATCRYPSSGALYPVQTYLYVKAGAVSGLAGGTYYLDPRDSALVTLEEGATLDAGIHAPHNRAVFEAAGFWVFLVADLDAIEPLYGRFARDFCLLEAGYMGQLLMDRVSRTEVGLCPIGAFDFDPVGPLLGLGERHLPVHSLLGGRVDRTAPARSAGTVERAEPLGDRLRAWLGERLPAHMVPQHVLTLDSWPLSPNGKVDRRALPAPRLACDAPGSAAPRTPTEERLAALWCEVLELPHVDVRDNFFELGGNSLAATRLIVRIRKAFRITIGLREVFTSRTIADLAVTVDRLGREPSESGEPSEADEKSDPDRERDPGAHTYNGNGYLPEPDIPEIEPDLSTLPKRMR